MEIKGDKKAFDDMFSISRFYNSACSYAANPIRIYPIMMSIVLHHYKVLKEKKFDKSFSSSDFDDEIIRISRIVIIIYVYSVFICHQFFFLICFALLDRLMQEMKNNILYQFCYLLFD